MYFRAGYSPDHYHGEAEWSARLMIERSKAIKCPNIQYHLAGTKKVFICKIISIFDWVKLKIFCVKLFKKYAFMCVFN